ncbi:MAG: MoxR-like ATPase [Planctomycetota bacterium]|jgi:MoxR-like ATPase
MNLEMIRETVEEIRNEYRKVVLGQGQVIDMLLNAMLCQGHVLLEGVPGTAKTLIAQTFASSMDLEFNRIQFTPDLMPGDVLGTNLFDFQSSKFTLLKGPVFTEILLADEINRTAPKTQSALLQAMQEREATIDGAHYDLSDAFMVVATQNPIEQEGTYPLPEAQLDRFLFKVVLDYPSRDDELLMVELHGKSSSMPDIKALGVKTVVSADFIRSARAAVREVQLSDELIAYIVDIVRATREHPSLYCGASPRSANMMASAARGRAVLEGRDFVIPDDIKALAQTTLSHRVVLAPGAEIDGTTASAVIDLIVNEVAAPR